MTSMPFNDSESQRGRLIELGRFNKRGTRCGVANEDLLSVVPALADEEDDADDDADDGEGAEDSTDDGSCWRAQSDLPLLFWHT